jgi:4,5-dihydroxyphthalate decarboxylase
VGTAIPRVSIGIGNRYDSLYLRNGTVKVHGFEVDYPTPGEKSRPQPTGNGYVAPSSIFTAVATQGIYDAGELALSTYFQAVDYGKEVAAIPVFPSRFFPHTQIAVHSDAGIRDPRDLAGKRFGVGFFSKNYAVWLRGILKEQYGVRAEEITWVEDEPEHFSEYRPPARFTVEKAPEGETLGSMLDGGKIAALAAPRAPERSKSPNVRALFQNPYPEIREYFMRHALFPINTVLTVPKAALKKNPHLPRAVFAAFSSALELYRDEVRRGVRDDEHSGLSLNRLEEESGVALPGYGFKANRDNLQTMLRYCREQGIVQKLYRPEDIFLLTET